LKKIEARGIRETAHRARSLASRIYRFAVATGRANRDIAADLRGALAQIVVKNRAAIIVLAFFQIAGSSASGVCP
jgi:hypothetical protein